MSGLKLFILTLVLFVYLLLGAVVFHFLEQDNEDVTRFTLHDVRRRILEEHQCLDEASLEVFMQAVIAARDSGIMLVGNQTSPTNWDFSSAFFFSGTVVTTIGYGKISPRTYYGQLVCMVYAALGIPLTAWLLASVGASYRTSFQRYMARAESGLKHVVSQVRLRQIMLWLIVGSVSYAAFLLFPSLLFVYLEEWTFHVAHYYSFITLTTIGFGDYLATVHGSSTAHWIYDFFVTIWNILGLAYLATLISVIREGEVKTAKSFRKFHAKILQKRKVYQIRKGKMACSENSESALDSKQIKRSLTQNGMSVEARYSRQNSFEEVSVIMPHESEEDHKESSTSKDVEEGNAESEQEDGAEQYEEIDAIIEVEGKILEEDDNMCIMLECESQDDVQTAESALQAAFTQDVVTASTAVPVKKLSLQHQLHPSKMYVSQGTQMELGALSE